MNKEIISGVERENRIQIVNCLPEQIQEIRFFFLITALREFI